jgi:hypothetical protein
MAAILIAETMATTSTTAAALDADVQALLGQHDFLEVVTTGEGEQQRVRVRCALTQHEMMPRVDAINEYLDSKKFRKARDWYCHDYSKYEPYIVAHRRKPKSLFCNVTGTVLNRIPAEVEKHVSGKKYKRMKEHVTVSTVRGKGEDGEDGDDFDANAFEFENSQAIFSDDEDEDGKPAATAVQLKQQDDVEEEEDEEEEEEDEEEEDVDDDMSDLYPEDDGSEDERVHELVQKALKAKGGEDESTGENEKPKKGKQPKSKKPKEKKLKGKQEAAGGAAKRASKGKTVKKHRPQTKRQRTDDA